MHVFFHVRPVLSRFVWMFFVDIVYIYTYVFVYIYICMCVYIYMFHVYVYLYMSISEIYSDNFDVRLTAQNNSIF